MENSNEKMTIAEKIAAQFGNDGQNFGDEPNDIETICRGEASHTYSEYENFRFQFPDNSALVISGSAWDLGFPGDLPDCYCLTESAHGHHDDRCNHSE